MSKITRAFLLSSIVGFIVSALLLITINTAHAEECPLAEGIVCGEWDYTGGRKSTDPIHHGMVPYPDMNDEEFAKAMKGYIVLMMSKAVQIMNNYQPPEDAPTQ